MKDTRANEEIRQGGGRFSTYSIWHVLSTYFSGDHGLFSEHFNILYIQEFR